MTYREILKTTGITEEQVAQAMGYQNANSMRTSSRCETSRDQFVRVYELLNATMPAESQNPAPTETLPPDPCKFLTFYREVATDKITAVTGCPGPAHPGTGDPNYALLAFVMFGDDHMVVPIPKAFLGTKWVKCDNPAAYKSGADLVKELMPSQSWHKFMEKVNIPNRYDGILSFRLEYHPDLITRLDGANAPVPFGSTDNVLAVLREDSHTCLAFDPMDSLFGLPNYNPSNTATTYIRRNTLEIDEKTARIVCPELFEYLDKLTGIDILSKRS
jgi:hypothetical protein